MNSVRWMALVILGWLAIGAQAQPSCAPTGDVSYVCGPKNPEDLVLVPGTQWIVSSGMAEGAGFYLVDSRAGSFCSFAVHGAARSRLSLAVRHRRLSSR